MRAVARVGVGFNSVAVVPVLVVAVAVVTAAALAAAPVAVVLVAVDAAGSSRRYCRWPPPPLWLLWPVGTPLPPRTALLLAARR